MVADEAAPAMSARERYRVGTICNCRVAGGSARWWTTSRTPAMRWSPKLLRVPPRTTMSGLSRLVA
ncbi:hypothetical protein [Streptomyces sp. NRRL F-5123]|uniref:hypothetical protein n=1 Tax=Streptomyces sp. NRRL F-5123 TaxID=1463856 RepID=UPI0004E129F5|nr:hypothetical protein [Streptomyces sp. NRRL F-5123]